MDSPRRVRVLHWEGPPPAVGDRLRSKRGRYLITKLDWPRALYVVAVRSGTIEGGREHPWTWARRGRYRGTPPALPPGHDTNRVG